ncbi:phage baseplate assembly protein V [Paraburkholderia sp. SOS3]|uniref:phage baseplate assembly protein V n=1 Tax=Paraburkholderia sp. SOS3 TaxID=1926494 RepID=UPI0009F9721C|nr:phage baseplate assembly protein V [Paraburkholderia sp. SOS3]
MMRPVPVTAVMVGEPPKPLIALKAERTEVQHKVNAIPTARIVLSVEGDALEDLITFQEEIAFCSAGQKVEVLLHEPDDRGHLIFRGVIVRQELSMTRARTELVLHLRHDLQKLQNTHRSQLFENMTDAVIATNLLVAQGIALLHVEGMSVEHDQLVQFRCSDWHFMRHRLGVNGVWAFPNPEGVEIAPPRLAPQPARTLRQRASVPGQDTLIEEGAWTFSEQFQPSVLTASSWNDHAQINDTVTGVATQLGSGAFNCAHGHEINDVPWSFNYSTPLRLDETTALAKGLLMNFQSSRASGEFLIDGSAHYALGQTLGIEGFGRAFDGGAIITGIRHRIAKGEGWRTLLTLGYDDVLREPMSMPRACGLHIGVVCAFKEDPDGMHRLQVRLPVLGESSNAVWARLAKPYASATSGFCFYPEVGDEVVVGFFDEDPSYPVILGSMHNPLNPAPIEPDAGNFVKALVVSHEGQQYQLRFDTQGQAVSLSSPHEQLSLKQGGELQTDSTLTLKCSSLTLSGQTSVSIEGPKIDFSS